MSDIEDFWIELFGMPPTPTEAALMESILQKVDSSDSILVQCAVMIRLQYRILVQDKRSPFRMLGELRDALDNLQEKIRRNAILEEETKDELRTLYWNVDHTICELREARDYVAEHKSFLSKSLIAKAATIFAIAAFGGTMAALLVFQLIA